MKHETTKTIRREYRLNGKKISFSEYLMTFQGMTKWIESRVQEAIDEGKEIPVFNTNAGPLVITVKEG